MGIENEPLRQLDGDHVPVTRHEVVDGTATDTYHVPGVALEGEENPPALSEDEIAASEVPVAVPVEVRTPDEAYASKPNIVRPPEDFHPESGELISMTPVDVDEDVEEPVAESSE